MYCCCRGAPVPARAAAHGDQADAGGLRLPRGTHQALRARRRHASPQTFCEYMYLKKPVISL